ELVLDVPAQVAAGKEVEPAEREQHHQAARIVRLVLRLRLVSIVALRDWPRVFLLALYSAIGGESAEAGVGRAAGAAQLHRVAGRQEDRLRRNPTPGRDQIGTDVVGQRIGDTMARGRAN